MIANHLVTGAGRADKCMTPIGGATHLQLEADVPGRAVDGAQPAGAVHQGGCLQYLLRRQHNHRQAAGVDLGVEGQRQGGWVPQVDEHARVAAAVNVAVPSRLFAQHNSKQATQACSPALRRP